ncbi:HpcH/HpaI aldolase/citrate lyase family protein [Pigmentiphaga sp.]|uniref:HpcH/HpaI aldolase family protein n=1 Tax=Pigmentiphaga sp. TaxID=1977564 RepID=UPI0025D2F270|nr:HpcH/HpaI aldolase/citrate lyase family protein [Pigmentiphaga sp.]
MTMLPINHFKRALRSGSAQLGVWSTIPSPYISELIAGAGYDWVLIDSEHTPTDVPLVLNQLQAVSGAIAKPGTVPSHPIVRPAWNDPVLIKRYLDVGAQTLLLPFVQNAEEARAAVSATRYAPHGIRGMGGSTRASNFGRIPDYVDRAADELCVLVQVETMQALDQIERIADVEGVDGIFIGPADLSASMGFPGKSRHPDVTRAIDDAIRRIRACGKAPGIMMTDEARARECLALGAQFVAVAIDTVLLRDGLDITLAQYRDCPQRTSAY